MKGPFFTLAVVLGPTAGFPVAAPMAAEIILAQESAGAADSSETRFRKLVVEPKGTEVKDPVVAPAPVETTTVQPKIVVQPEGVDAPADSGKGKAPPPRPSSSARGHDRAGERGGEGRSDPGDTTDGQGRPT